MKMTKEIVYVNDGKDILLNKGTEFVVSCQVNNTGVSSVNGEKKIPAGTPIGGTTSIITNPRAVLSVTNSSTTGVNAQGILLDAVDVTDGNADAQIVIRGVIDTSKCPTLDATVITALKGAITFVNGGKQ
nr:MAG TPA: Head decoration protein [Caudoviricetes sp.]